LIVSTYTATLTEAVGVLENSASYAAWVRVISSFFRLLFLILVAFQVNVGDNTAIKSPFGAGGGGYSAVGDAACAASNPSDVFPTAEGVDCRWYVAGGGGGASSTFPGAPDNVGGVRGNSRSSYVPFPPLPLPFL
jgi:hypothetical protein